jgi:hypothetical protein
MDRHALRSKVSVAWQRVLAAAVVALTVGSATAQGAGPSADAPSVRVGDQWKFERVDRRTGVKEGEFLRAITAVTPSKIEGTENNEKFAMTADLNVMESSIGVQSGNVKYLDFPLQVGKKWRFEYASTSKASGRKYSYQIDASIVAQEMVRVPAGEFDAFKIEYKGSFTGERLNRRIVQASWYAPAARAPVRIEYDDTVNNWAQQLVEVQLQP